jgi:hypothetical protein
MKILIPNHTEIDAATGYLKVSSSALKLSEVTQGKHVGLVPITMKGANSMFERLYRVEVSGEASDNGKGYRRVMLKVTIPYHRIWTADPAAAANLREKQESTSAGSISMHVVLSIPSRVRQDLLESSDAAATYGAEGHLAVVGALLSALTGQIRKPTLVQTPTGPNGELETAHPKTWVADDEGDATMAEYDMLNAVSDSNQFPVQVEPYSSERFGTSGLSCNWAMDRAYLSQAPRDPLVRGLFGLVPLEENTAVIAGPELIMRQGV